MTNQESDVCPIPMLCPKCVFASKMTYKEVGTTELISCKSCGFKFKNPVFANSWEEIAEDAARARDC